MYKINVLVSGKGSTLDNLAFHCKDDFDGMLYGVVDVCSVVADRDCLGVEVAKRWDIPTFVIKREDFEDDKSWSEALFKGEAQNYRILHLATHFLSDDRQPLYSKLALAPAEGSDEDGYLQVYEVLNTKLRAELVVLSACNTGLGRLQRGEGLLGATRAFLYAGVPSMVVSLWSVEDRAAAQIMERFYVHLKEGSDKREALRARSWTT